MVISVHGSRDDGIAPQQHDVGQCNALQELGMAMKPSTRATRSPDVHAALARLESGTQFGKVVIDIA